MPSETTVPAPQKLVVDCAAWGARALFDEATDWQARAEEVREAGDDARANACARNAESCRIAARNALIAAGLPDEQAVEPESWAPLSGEELVQREADAVEALESAWSMLRARRDALLGASDWTQLPDAPLSATEAAAWNAYRQKLRDLPARISSPHDPPWPEPPV